VRRTLFAAAIAAAAGIGLAGLAYSADEPAASTPLGAEQEGGPGDGMMMRHHWMMHRMLMMQQDPQQWCLDGLARRAGRLAYLGVRLNLTPQQQPLWEKVQGVAQDAQQKGRQLCTSLKPEPSTTIMDRLDRREQFLSLKLSALQAARPALQALYQALTPEQRAILDHPLRHG